MEKRFKVGDIITHTQFPESKLRVAFVESGTGTVPYECDVLDPGKPCDDGESLSTYVENNRRRWVSISHAAPYEAPKKQKRPQPDEVVVIKRFGDRTEARSSALAKTVTIKRFKDDKHDMHKACIYALDKLFEGDGVNVTINPRFYTGAVVCVESTINPSSVGRLFMVKNGSILGCVYMTHLARTFDDLNKNVSGYKFMEVRI